MKRALKPHKEISVRTVAEERSKKSKLNGRAPKGAESIYSAKGKPHCNKKKSPWGGREKRGMKRN